MRKKNRIKIEKKQVQDQIRIQQEKELDGKSIRRSILTCLEKKCQKCAMPVLNVPDSCPFKILHVMDTDMEIKWMPRQSGKTRRLVEIANQLVKIGFPVLYVTLNLKSASYVRDRFHLDVRAELVSLGQIKDGILRGKSPCYVLADEVWAAKDQEWKWELKAGGHRIVAAYTT